MNDDKPTEITAEDIETFVNMLLNSEIKKHSCFKCSKEFIPNYDDVRCDECFFAQFPAEHVKSFYRSFFE